MNKKQLEALEEAGIKFEEDAISIPIKTDENGLIGENAFDDFIKAFAGVLDLEESEEE